MPTRARRFADAKNECSAGAPTAAAALGDRRKTTMNHVGEVNDVEPRKHWLTDAAQRIVSARTKPATNCHPTTAWNSKPYETRATR